MNPLSASNNINFTTPSGFELNVPDGADYTIQKVGNTEFQIPLKLIENNVINNDSSNIIINDDGKYLKISVYSRERLNESYGSDLYTWGSLYVANKLIDGHPAKIIVGKSETQVYF